MNNKFSTTANTVGVSLDGEGKCSADDSIKIDTTIIRSMVEGLSFDVKPGWCDMLKRKYGPTITEIGVRGSSYHCRDTLDTIAFDTLRATEQVKVIPLIGCENATQQYNTKETAYRVCQGEPFVLSFSAAYMNKDDASNPYKYHVLIEHTWEDEKGDPQSFGKDAGNNDIYTEKLKVVSNYPNAGDETTCDGEEAWWDGSASNCKTEITYTEADAGYHKYIVYVATNKCETAGFAGCAFPTTYDIKQYIADAKDGCDPCGYTWDTDTIVVAVGRKPKAPKIAMVSSDYFVDVEIKTDPTQDTTTVFKTWDESKAIDKEQVEKFIEKIVIDDDQEEDPQIPDDVIFLYDGDGDNKKVVARTKDSLKSGDPAWKICFLELEQGDSMTCNPTTTDYLDRELKVYVEQKTFTYEWQRKLGGLNQSWETVKECHYASYTAYQEKSQTVFKFDSLLQPDLDGNKLVHYRLKMSDCCGNHSYSNIITISSLSSDPIKPAIGFDTTSNADECKKRDTSVTYTDNEKGDLTFCYDTLKWVCAGEPNPELKIELANVGDFDQNTHSNDPFKFKWEYRSKKRPETGAITWDDTWDEIIDANRLEQTGNQAGASLNLTENYQAGNVYQYRVTSYFSSDEGEEGALPDNAEKYKISDTVTVMVYKNVTNKISESNSDSVIFVEINEEGTIDLKMEIGNPDGLDCTYEWYAGKPDTDWGEDVITALSADNKKEYLIEKLNNDVLTVNKKHADTTTYIYKVKVKYECGEIVQIFKVKAVKSKLIKPVIGRLVTKENVGRDKNYKYKNINNDEKTIYYNWDTTICSTPTFVDECGKIDLANNEQFDDYTSVVDKYHFEWQRRKVARGTDGTEDWAQSEEWENIGEVTTDNNKNSARLDLTSETFDKGWTYQYRLRVYTDNTIQPQKDDEENIKTDESGKAINDTIDVTSDSITIKVFKELTSTVEDQNKRFTDCARAAVPKTFEMTYDSDGAPCTYKWEVGKGTDVNTITYEEVDISNETQKAAYFIESVNANKLTINKMPDNSDNIYCYRATVMSRCSDPISEVFEVQANVEMKLLEKDIYFLGETGGRLPSIDDGICEGKEVTVLVESDIEDGDQNNSITLQYMFYSSPDPTAPNSIPEETELQELGATTIVYENPIKDEKTVQPPTPGGHIWLKITDGCSTTLWSNPLYIEVKKRPDVPKIQCDELDRKDEKIICLEDTLEFYYDLDGLETANCIYTWSVQSQENTETEDYCVILEADPDPVSGQYKQADAPYLKQSPKIKIVWNSGDIEDVILLTVYNKNTDCDSVATYPVKICNEKRPHPIDIVRKDTTTQILIALDSTSKWFQWGYTSKQDNKEYVTEWHSYKYWRYDFEYQWITGKAGRIDTSKNIYWVQTTNADEVEKSYCTPRKSYWTGKYETGKEVKQYNYHFFVRTQSDVQNTQKIPIWIDNPKREVVHLYLISPMGVMVAQKQLPAEETIETSLPATFSSGIYFLHVQVGDERTTIKIRIQ